jgi:hypothetical protein
MDVSVFVRSMSKQQQNKAKTKTLAERARDLGIGPKELAKAAGLSRTTIWMALKINELPSRNAAAAKLRRALKMDEPSHV